MPNETILSDDPVTGSETVDPAEKRSRPPFFVRCRVPLIAAAVVLLLAAAAFLLLTPALTVRLNGEKLCSVSDRLSWEEAAAGLEAEIYDLTGRPFDLSEAVTLRRGLGFRWKKRDAAACRDRLISLFADRIHKVPTLILDGTPVASAADTAALTEAIDRLLAAERDAAQKREGEAENALPGELLDVRLHNAVTVEDRFCLDDQVMTADGILSFLSGGTSPVPVVFEYVRSVTETVQTAFGTAYADSPEHYIGYTNVQKEGVPGQSVLTCRIGYLSDGTVTERTVDGISVLAEPQDQKVLRGTRAVPTTDATGRFIWPCDIHIITSLQGDRDLWGTYDFHYGIDIAAGMDDPVYASDSGVVICAEEQESYGNVVMISHGNGYVTYYAHLNSFSVAVGDEVYQGKEIGKAGMTGVASGYHLHFEIRLDNELCDPVDYLDMTGAELPPQA